MFAYIGCQNFYIACERSFNPMLEKKAIVIMSYDTGYVVAVSKEAQQLGVRVDMSLAQVTYIARQRQIILLAANYTLYADMSDRLVASLRYFCADLKVCALNEFVLKFKSAQSDLKVYLQRLRKKIKQWTGISLAIGLAPTQTLAKVAYEMAEKNSHSKVALIDRDNHQRVLENCALPSLLNIHGFNGKALSALGIATAWDLTKASLEILQSLDVNLETLAKELQGESCISGEVTNSARHIVISKKFNRQVKTLAYLKDTAADSIIKAQQKLKADNKLVQAVCVQLYIDRQCVGEDASYSAIIGFGQASNDVKLLSQVIRVLLEKIFKLGPVYRRCDILLLDLVADVNANQELSNKKLHEQNGLQVKEESVDFVQVVASNKSRRCSPQYTTDWEDLPRVR